MEAERSQTVRTHLRTVVALSGGALPALDGEGRPESDEAPHSHQLQHVSRQRDS